jgi:hypothetical protein
MKLSRKGGVVFGPRLIHFWISDEFGGGFCLGRNIFVKMAIEA